MSTSILTISTLSPIFSESCAKMEDCILQGPHQVAKKSTSTGRVPLMISDSLFIVEIFSKLLIPKGENRRSNRMFKSN